MDRRQPRHSVGGDLCDPVLRVEPGGGARTVGRSAIVLFVALLAPFVVLVGCGYWVGLHHLLQHVGHPQSAAPHGANHYGNVTTALLVAMWNYMGWDNASTVAQEVENPRRNYPLAMLATCGIVALSYILPLSAIAAAGIPVDQFTTGSWTDAARLLAGPWLAVAIVIGGIINGVGMFNALTLSYTRLPVVMAEDRMMPSALARRNRRRSPWVAILLCGLGWALALGFTYERLISIDLILYGASLVLEFAALIALRVKQPEMVRPFRIPGGMAGVWVVSVCPVALLGYAAYVSRSEQVAHLPALLFGLLVAARRARLLSALAAVVGQTDPHTTTHRDCCGLKDGRVMI